MRTSVSDGDQTTIRVVSHHSNLHKTRHLHYNKVKHMGLLLRKAINSKAINSLRATNSNQYLTSNTSNLKVTHCRVAGMLQHRRLQL